MPQLGVEVGQAGHVELGQLGRGASAATRLRRQPCAGHGVVDQHDLAVGAQPGVGLEAPGAQLQGPAEGRERVLGRVGAGAPVGEGDR